MTPSRHAEQPMDHPPSCQGTPNMVATVVRFAHWGMLGIAALKENGLYEFYGGRRASLNSKLRGAVEPGSRLEHPSWLRAPPQPYLKSSQSLFRRSHKL